MTKKTSTRRQKCTTCKGTGRIEIARPPFSRACMACDGTGKARSKFIWYAGELRLIKEEKKDDGKS